MNSVYHLADHDLIQPMRLLHFGSPAFDPKKFKRIRNNWLKPTGGLWATLKDSSFGWDSWCRDADFNTEALSACFSFRLKEGATVVVINCLADLELLPFKRVREFHSIVDFERMVRQGIDGIYLTAQGQIETRFSYPKTLYGWDCECVLILNKQVIEI